MAKAADTKKDEKPKLGFCPVRAYTYDDEKSVEGVWFNQPEGYRIKVARASNPKAMECSRKLSTEYSDQITGATEEEKLKITEEIAERSWATTILLDWEGVVDLEGNEIPYSPEIGAEYLKFPEFFYAVSARANDANSFLKYKVEEASKN